MLSWSQKRQYVIVGSILFVLFLFFGVRPLIRLVTVEQTCFDGKQNQHEVGIDCGGECSRLCASQITQPSVLWARFFPASKEYHNVIAYVENPNATGLVRRIPYTISLYDRKNILIVERKGETFMLPKSVVPIFEAQIYTGARVPYRAFLELAKNAPWEVMKVQDGLLEVQNVLMTDIETEPQINANLYNTTFVSVEDFEVIVTVFNRSGNAIATSRTFVEKVPASGLTPIVFKWFRPFDDIVSKIEIIPRVFTPDYRQ